MRIEFTSQIVDSYKRLSYEVWYALAEFIDNSTQAYENNKEILDKIYEKEMSLLEVFIDYITGDKLGEDYFVIKDNSIGMDEADLETAFKIGMPPANIRGRSRYGLGMKTAAFWLGNQWSVTTKKLNHNKKLEVNLDVHQISEGNLDLEIISSDAPKEEHYTIIKINSLHRKFKGRTIGKIKDFLSSMYRFDIKEKQLNIYWNEKEKLEWSEYRNEHFIKNNKDEPVRIGFKFEVGGKSVYGWAGALRNGGRAKGGFALIQAKRVIQGPPRGYKPESIFGEQTGGINNLVNQRIVGEIHLEEFKISHTKDSIQWQGAEEDDLDELLFEKVKSIVKVAKDFRFREVDENAPNDLEIQAAIDELLEEIKSPESHDIIFINEVPADEIISISNKEVLKYIIAKEKGAIDVKVGTLNVRLIIGNDMSPNDPYVLYELTSEEIIIIVSKSHPFWNELKDATGVLNYLRQCVYDGIAEWKAYIQKREITAETVKYIKDNLMRLAFKIQNLGSSNKFN